MSTFCVFRSNKINYEMQINLIKQTNAIYIYILFFEKLISTNVYTLLYSIHSDRNNLLLFWIRNRILYFLNIVIIITFEQLGRRNACSIATNSPQHLSQVHGRVVRDFESIFFTIFFFIHNIMNGFCAYNMYCTLVYRFCQCNNLVKNILNH